MVDEDPNRSRRILSPACRLPKGNIYASPSPHGALSGGLLLALSSRVARGGGCGGVSISPDSVDGCTYVNSVMYSNGCGNQGTVKGQCGDRAPREYPEG